jgi:gamma-glutamyl-gamma-aminobutyrate hydrolase PuuD
MYAKANKIPMVGICRGMQLFTIMHGGKLLQHIEGHAMAGSHIVKTVDGQNVLVNSLHHQVCIPYDFSKNKYVGEVLAWSNTGRNWKTSPKVEEIFVDLGCIPEAIWWSESKALGVQFHPEMMSNDVNGYKYFQSIFDKYIG